MNNTLEGNNSRKTETEQINDLKDKMVEISAAEQNTEKEWKEMKTAQETTGTTLSAPTFVL